MSVKELERAVLCLTPKELTRFRQWFADYDMVQWDKQIEEDSLSGRLDHLIENAMEGYRAGHTTDL